ncbi:unnamed protein product [Microthlaspi erraticum]|uniref:O-methyltransferase C-terminal domain-containing protein n=1 Tax=Microthlaspi erraticum TaxID=1685480 RepID=A0A6D2I3S7_9BRAS|nr:unnamed protein product [Microthlaspi erraticum]
MANHLPDPLTTSTKPSLNKEERFDEETLSLQGERILYTAMAFPMVFKSALELGVIDTIAAVDEASYSILKYRMVETGENGATRKFERVYAAEPVCMSFLNRGDGSGSLASLFMLSTSEVFFKTWAHLKDLILEGKDAFTSAHGMKLFEYVGFNEQLAELLNRGMSEGSTLTMKKVLEVYRGFEDVNTLVDVGGGIGTIVGLVTSKYPHIKGINFDLASAIAHAPLYPGVKHVSGDMFIEIPKGDAIFMKWILHDWSDEDCVKILKIVGKVFPRRKSDNSRDEYASEDKDQRFCF